MFHLDAFEFLVDKVGAARVLLGSDYPFPIGDPAPLKVIENSKYDADAKAAMRGGGAVRARPFRLTPPRSPVGGACARLATGGDGREEQQSMRAILCKAWGDVETLTLEDIDPPTPKPDQLLIDVKATAVNYADSIMVAGNYQTKPPFPFSPGLETAGIVAACGAEVSRFKPGDRVMAILAYGGMAEQVAAEEAECYAIPDAMPFDEAGAFPIAYISSHVAIRWQGRLEPGESMLVLGAAGGVGLTAVEIGKAMGARVIAAASSAEKLAAAAGRGADEGINYTQEDLKERVMALTDGKGVDVCFDPVGGDLFDPALSSLGWGGRILLVGFVGGIPKIPANRLLVKHRSAMGSSLRYFRWYAPDKLRKSMDELLAWYGEGKLKPLVGERFPLARAVDAIKLLTDRRAIGKVIVTTDPIA